MRTVLFLVALAGCTPHAPKPALGDCSEFDYPTTRDGVSVVCRMLWCQGFYGDADRRGRSAGPAVLWCR